jgi:transposase
MQTDTPATVVATTARSDVSTLFASLELSRSKWLVTVNSPGGEKFSKHVVEGGGCGSLLDLLARLRSKAEQRSGLSVKVMVLQEAGLDGFWLHRLLVDNGIESHVVDPASIAVEVLRCAIASLERGGRHRRAKTDAIVQANVYRERQALTKARRCCGRVNGLGPR